MHCEFLKFINGMNDFNGDLCELPGLQMLRGRVRLLTAIEREVEAKHKTTWEIACLTTNIGGAFINIGLREPEIVIFLQSDQ